MSRIIESKRVLVSWIGKTDLNASQNVAAVGIGPIAQALKARSFDLVVLLIDYPESEGFVFVRWAEQFTSSPVELRPVKLTSPVHFADIYQAVTECVQSVLDRCGAATQLTYHLSPGTPAMAAVWIIVAKTRYAAELLESSREHGVRTATIPFDISAEFIPNLLRGPDRTLSRLTGGLAEEASAFEAIIHRSAVMQRVIEKAQKVAPRSVPVLIEGESGTGKEMLARAIHEAGSRRNAPFISVNCGAIPKELVESEFFGHKKGAFTGAHSDRKGHFEMANGGTLFLDEVGELPLEIQVKLLRVLQQGEVVRVGESSAIAINVRILAATNRTLSHEVAAGRFREDLFYRLAVAVIRLPPLRSRTGDLTLLIDHVLNKVNRDSAAEPAWEEKKLSVSARNILIQHSWPGNVRELLNTLTRAVVWSAGSVMTEEDIRDALLDTPSSVPEGESILNRPIQEGFDLQELMATVAKHYLERALDQTQGNRTKAAEMLGFGSYQTLNNWIKKYRLEN